MDYLTLPSAFQNFLEFLYTDWISKEKIIEEDLVPLLLLAIQYNLEFLAGICRNYISQEIQKENKKMKLDSIPTGELEKIQNSKEISVERRSTEELSAQLRRVLICSSSDYQTNDVVFIVEGKPIRCHKAILAIRSTYFRTVRIFTLN